MMESNLKLKYIEIRNKITIGQGCLLDYEYIKNNFKLVAIQQIEILGQLKDNDDVNSDGTQSMFILTILEKIKETEPKFHKDL